MSPWEKNLWSRFFGEWDCFSLRWKNPQGYWCVSIVVGLATKEQNKFLERIEEYTSYMYMYILITSNSLHPIFWIILSGHRSHSSHSWHSSHRKSPIPRRSFGNFPNPKLSSVFCSWVANRPKWNMRMVWEGPHFKLSTLDDSKLVPNSPSSPKKKHNLTWFQKGLDCNHHRSWSEKPIPRPAYHKQRGPFHCNVSMPFFFSLLKRLKNVEPFFGWRGTPSV